MAISPQFLAGYSDRVTSNFDFSSLSREDADAFEVGFAYRLDGGWGFDTGYIKYQYASFQNLKDAVTTDVTINDHPNHILRFGDGANPWRIGTQLKEQHGVQFDWNTHISPIGVYGDFQVPPNIAERFLSAYANHMIGIEPNAGISGVPAPSGDPANWIAKPAFPMPIVKMELSR